MRPKQKYISKTFLLGFFSFWFIFISFTIIIGVILSFNLISTKTNEYISQYQKLDASAEKVIKSRTLSLFFAKKEGSFQYHGTYGTSWVIPNGVKSENGTLKCYLATNVHVVSNFINATTNQQKQNIDYSYSLNNNFDCLFLSYFDAKKPQIQHGLNVDEREFVQKENIKILKIFAGQDDDNKYKIEENYIHNNYNDPNNVPSPFIKNENDNQWYLKNWLHDLAILRLDITNDNQNLYQFMNNIYENDKNGQISLIEFNDLATLKNDIESFYVGGFPYINNKLKWKGYSIPIKDDHFKISSSIIMDKQFLFRDDINFMLDGKREVFKNISNQILIDDLNIGSGSSGSMLIAKLKNRDEYKILGICWGVYEESNDKKSWEAADLFISIPKPNAADLPNWEDYNLVEEMHRIINNDKQ